MIKTNSVTEVVENYRNTVKTIVVRVVIYKCWCRGESSTPSLSPELILWPKKPSKSAGGFCSLGSVIGLFLQRFRAVWLDDWKATRRVK